MYTLQALDGEGYARSLVVADEPSELVTLALMLMQDGHECRIWDRARNAEYHPDKEAVCALL